VAKEVVWEEFIKPTYSINVNEGFKLIGIIDEDFDVGR
jgi:hypothetical protein